MEGARRATGISSSGRTGDLAELSVVLDSEVPEKAVRRRFTVEYKRRILREAEACKAQCQVGTLLRLEGLYSSHLNTWRRQAARGTFEALSPKKRGPKEKNPDPSLRRIAELEKATQKLEHTLRQAELIIAAQKNCRDLSDVPRFQGRDELMKMAESLAKAVNVQQACAALAVPRASFYRCQDPAEDDRQERQRSIPPLALSDEEENTERINRDSSSSGGDLSGSKFGELTEKARFLMLHYNISLLTFTGISTRIPIKSYRNGGKAHEHCIEAGQFSNS
jgi:transposase-like protein